MNQFFNSFKNRTESITEDAKKSVYPVLIVSSGIHQVLLLLNF